MKWLAAILILSLAWIAWELYRAPTIEDDGEDRSHFQPHP
jgi:hypothetical protein